MSDSSLPTWVPIVFSGGLLGALTFLVKQITDKKDATIASKDAVIAELREQVARLDKFEQKNDQLNKSRYESRISALQRESEQLKKEIQVLSDFRELLSSNLDEMKKQGITSETDSKVRGILKYLNQLQACQESEMIHRSAANWIRSKKNEWLTSITEYAIDKYRNDVGNHKTAFLHDIDECLEWLYDSVFYNVPHQLSDYLDQPSIGSMLPYRAAFNYLKQLDETGDLNQAEADFFYTYLDALIQLLQDKH